MNIKNWNTNYKLALALCLSLFLWMLTGLFSTNEEQEDLQSAARDSAGFVVQVAQSRAQPYRRPVFVRGRTEANRAVQVVAEIDGNLLATPAREGGFVEVGEPLCVLDSQDRLLRREQALAQRDKAKIDYEGALKLKDGGFQSKSQIASAKAALAVAEAELKTSTLATEQLVIRAPFDGLVQERYVDAGAFIQRGDACAQLLELSPLLVVGHVAESDIVHLQEKDRAEVRFLDGSVEQGVLRYLSKAADEITRTFKIEVEINNEKFRFADGLSVDLLVYTGELNAHLISPSLLALTPEGEVGLKILDSGNIVRFVNVELLGDDEKGVWVSGLPDQATLITVGQEYVEPGSKVAVMSDEAAVSNDSISISGGSK